MEVGGSDKAGGRGCREEGVLPKSVFLKEAVGFVRLARQIVSFNRYYEVPVICYKTEETIETNSYMLRLRECCC